MSDKDTAQEKLRELPIKAGNRFSHYKRAGAYVVVALAVKEDTLEPLVVYREEGAENIWVRTYANFTEKVEENGLMIARFTRLN